MVAFKLTPFPSPFGLQSSAIGRLFSANLAYCSGYCQ
jgi:hypothetical protein